MAVLTSGFVECGINSFCEKRGTLLHRASRQRSGKGLVSVRSCSYWENERKKGPRKSDGLGASAWWLPLFGWSPDHKWAEEKKPEEDGVGSVRDSMESKSKKEDQTGIKRPKNSKSVPVRFTAEKAKILRKTLRSTSTFHDLMYHSAIASRLASADTSSTEEDSKNEKA